MGIIPADDIKSRPSSNEGSYRQNVLDQLAGGQIRDIVDTLVFLSLKDDDNLSQRARFDLQAPPLENGNQLDTPLNDQVDLFNKGRLVPYCCIG